MAYLVGYVMSYGIVATFVGYVTGIFVLNPVFCAHIAGIAANYCSSAQSARLARILRAIARQRNGLRIRVAG
jgi:hypothetical protein